MSIKSFYQDFLFKDINYNKNEYPNVVMIYNYNVAKNEEFDMSISQDGKDISIRFSILSETTKEEKWQRILAHIETCNSVTLVDDLQLKNEELLHVKQFYMLAYYDVLSKACRKCYCARED